MKTANAGNTTLLNELAQKSYAAEVIATQRCLTGVVLLVLI